MLIKKSNGFFKLFFNFIFTCITIELTITYTLLSSAKKLSDISWDPQNEIFNNIDNKGPVIQAQIMDRIKINCPKSRENERKYKYSKLYAVSKEGYEKCSLLDSKIIGTCKNPSLNSSINIVFREISPLAGALVFKPGEDYYLISTSTGTLEGIDNSEGGLCLTDNMRIKFEIQEKDNDHKMMMTAQKNIENKKIIEDNSSMLPDILQTFNDNSALVYTIHNADVEYNDEDMFNYSSSGFSLSHNINILFCSIFILISYIIN